MTIAMVVNSHERKKRYERIIAGLLLKKEIRAAFLTYDTAASMYAGMVNGTEQADIILLPAGHEIFALAKELRRVDRNCIILFIAANMEHVLSAFPSMPMAYVVPARDDRENTLAEAILCAADYIIGTRRDILFETKSEVLHYAFFEIDYFESQYRIVHIMRRTGQSETITGKLDDVEKLLPGNFFRCHQSYLVNMDSISHIDKGNKEIHLTSGHVVPSSKKLFPGLLSAYRDYRGGENSNVQV